MSKLLLLILALFSVNICLAQKLSVPLKNVHYYTPSSNRWVSEVTVTADSITFFKSKSSNTEDHHSFKIVSEEKKGDYFLIYIKSARRPVFDVFALRFAKNDYLYVWSDLTDRYKSLDEIKSAFPDTSFSGKYFSTWYAKQKFDQLIKYPDLLDADKPMVQKVTDEWVSQLKQNANQTRPDDMYGAGRGIDMLAKVLVNNHLSPMASLTDANKKMVEYNIKIPYIPIKRTPRPIRLDTGKTKNENIVIGAPTGNH
ncbi:hypothetical protein [Mucilaginibacter sp. dw_454]|uniref:hypothetical protein n=1 Tax=Mucilaginibacter sp. dw_454 TaxID=2720079 RepID=UPI001BD6C80D|nr:hypothetical protein [Mucilaginibacter sp. dw_454]